MQRFSAELSAYQGRIITRFDRTSTILSVVMIFFTVVNILIVLAGLLSRATDATLHSMALPDASALNSLLGRWEIAEYISASVVILAVVGEFTAEFTNLLQDESKRRRLAKASVLVLIGGLAVELVCLVRTSQLSALEVARLNERAANAELVVQRLRLIAAPRWVEEKPFLEALKDQPKPAGVLIVFAEDNESRRLASQIMGLLFQAGWHVYFPTPIVRAKYSATYLSSAETLGGQPSGLTIVAKDKEGWHVPPFNHNTPYDAIWNAFIKAHYPTLYAGRDDTLPDSVLRIVVGSKESPLVP